MAKWAAGHGYVGIQIPSWDRRLFDLERAAESQDYCDEVKGVAAGGACGDGAFDALAGATGGEPSGV
jgi:sugar phosphate isomerase/epimerase